MKKCFIFALVTLLLVSVSSCSTYTGGGAYVGAQFGHVIGSAIGGINGGWRGHHQGALIGTIGGAVAGAAIGAAVENSQNRKYEPDVPMQRGINQRESAQERYDDRIDFDESPSVVAERSFSVEELSRKTPIELRNAMVTDKTGDGILVRGEECMVSFEVMNNTNHPVYDLCPIVEDATGNKHVAVSPNLRVECIPPHEGIRYTATILADKRLKDGEIIVRVGVARNNQLIASQTREFTLPTRKKIAQ